MARKGKPEGGKPRRIPSLCTHRASGLGYATDPDTHKPVYFGPRETPECVARYEEWVREFLARKPGELEVATPAAVVTVTHLARRFLAHAEAYYVKHGQPTSEVKTIRNAIRYVLEGCATLPADDFTPAKLREVRERMIAAGLARSGVNAYVSRIRRCWRWGVEEGLVRGEVYQSLRAVRDLAKGRTAAPERPRVQPAPEADVEAVVAVLPQHVATMVRLQRLAGMRPNEVVKMRPVDIDRTAHPWIYRPETHKTEHHGVERIIYLGPKCREILKPLLDACRRPTAYLFPSREKVRPGSHYAVSSYWTAVDAACTRAGVPHLFPNQLRHSAATEIRARHGIEAVRIVLGHADVTQSQVYAARDEALARKVAEELG